MFFDWEGVAATITVGPSVRLLTATINDNCAGTIVGGGSRWAVSMTSADGSVTPTDHRIALFYSDSSISEYVLYSNPTAKCDPRCNFSGPTTFTLTRLTESRLSGCGVLGNLSVAAFSSDVAFANPPPPSPRLLEFVGDSITAGDLNAGFYSSGVDSPNVCGNAAFNNDILLGYGAALCRLFGSDCMHSAWGGITLEGMVPLYPYTFSSMGSGQAYSPYAFSRPADAVIINLGTNGGDNVPGYIAFADSVVSKYYKNTSIALFLAYGPMTDFYEEVVLQVVANLTSSGLRAFALNLTLEHGMTGCYGHPSAADDVEIAAKAQPQIAKALGW